MTGITTVSAAKGTAVAVAAVAVAGVAVVAFAVAAAAAAADAIAVAAYLGCDKTRLIHSRSRSGPTCAVAVASKEWRHCCC
jgi:phage-related minor tail protein